MVELPASGRLHDVNEMSQFRSAVIEQASGFISALDDVHAIDVRCAVLVEGVSDEAAIRTLAVRRNRDLDAERVCVVPIGGATNIRRYLELLGPPGLGVRLAGLCDVGEERHFQRAADRTGLVSSPDRSAMESLGFFVCDADLEDELIRSLGTPAVEAVIEELGDLDALRTFQNQPAQRDRSIERQLRRFMGTLSGRKERYAGSLAKALDPDRVPRPLALLLEHL